MKTAKSVLISAILLVCTTASFAETVFLRWGDTYSLPEGKILTFKFCAHDLQLSNTYQSVEVLATLQGEVILFHAKPETLMPTVMLDGTSSVNHSGVPEASMVLCGPAEISTFVTNDGLVNARYFQMLMCVEDLNPPAASLSTTIPTCAVVIPTDAEGPVEIRLESSEDMVNWNTAIPGTYGASDSNRFFRVRAELAP